MTPANSPILQNFTGVRLLSTYRSWTLRRERTIQRIRGTPPGRISLTGNQIPERLAASGIIPALRNITGSSSVTNCRITRGKAPNSATNAQSEIIFENRYNNLNDQLLSDEGTKTMRVHYITNWMPCT